MAYAPIARLSHEQRDWYGPQRPSSKVSLEEHEHGEEEKRCLELSPFVLGPSTKLAYTKRNWRRALGSCAVICGALVLFMLGAFSSDMILMQGQPATTMDGLESFLGPSRPREEGFTIVAPTYKRTESLPKFLDTYASGDIPSLRRIVILWNDIETEPSQSLVDLLPSYPVPIIIEQRHINSLNQRFLESENIVTECTLAIDDDMFYSSDDVEMAFRVWKEFGQGRKKMVGFHPRAVSENDYLPGTPNSYSMVLTKSAFFHTDWMNAYWSNEMAPLRKYVDDNFNCEDILMSFLHAYHTRLPPIFVSVNFRDEGLTEGIWTHPGHWAARSACIKEFSTFFGPNTLVESRFKVDRF